jgi:hypothetical protein
MHYSWSGQRVNGLLQMRPLLLQLLDILVQLQYLNKRAV